MRFKKFLNEAQNIEALLYSTSTGITHFVAPNETLLKIKVLIWANRDMIKDVFEELDDVVDKNLDQLMKNVKTELSDSKNALFYEGKCVWGNEDVKKIVEDDDEAMESEFIVEFSDFTFDSDGVKCEGETKHAEV